MLKWESITYASVSSGDFTVEPHSIARKWHMELDRSNNFKSYNIEFIINNFIAEKAGVYATTYVRTL